MNRDKRKKKKDIRRKARNQYLADRNEYVRHYPQFVFEGEADAPPSFVREIKEAAAKIDFRDFPQNMRMVLQHFRYDPRGLMEQLREHDIKKNGIGTVVISDIATETGQRIFDIVGKDKLQQWVPYCFPELGASGSNFLIKFSTMQSTRGDHGTIHFHSGRPRVNFEGVDYTVGWSRHSIDQICRRITPEYQTYAGVATVYSFLSEGHQEFCRLNNGDVALTFFDVCVPRMWSSKYVEEILGEKILDPNYDYSFRLGYCPIVFENGFAKAMTLLCPGYRRTPEHKVISRQRLSWDEKKVLLDKAEGLTTEKLYDNSDFSMLKLYHDNGIPQVIKKERPPKKPPKPSYSLASKILTSKLGLGRMPPKLIMTITDVEEEEKKS